MLAALFTAGADGNVLMWDVCNLEILCTLTGHKEGVTCLILLRQLKELLG